MQKGKPQNDRTKQDISVITWVSHGGEDVHMQGRRSLGFLWHNKDIREYFNCFLLFQLKKKRRTNAS